MHGLTTLICTGWHDPYRRLQFTYAQGARKNHSYWDKGKNHKTILDIIFENNRVNAKCNKEKVSIC